MANEKTYKVDIVKMFNWKECVDQIITQHVVFQVKYFEKIIYSVGVD